MYVYGHSCSVCVTVVGIIYICRYIKFYTERNSRICTDSFVCQELCDTFHITTEGEQGIVKVNVFCS